MMYCQTFIVDGDNLVWIDIIYPQSYSIYDIALFNIIWGNTTYHTGNDIYTLS